MVQEAIYEKQEGLQSASKSKQKSESKYKWQPERVRIDFQLLNKLTDKQSYLTLPKKNR